MPSKGPIALGALEYSYFLYNSEKTVLLFCVGHLANVKNVSLLLRHLLDIDTPNNTPAPRVNDQNAVENRFFPIGLSGPPTWRLSGTYPLYILAAKIASLCFRSSTRLRLLPFAKTSHTPLLNGMAITLPIPKLQSARK